MFVTNKRISIPESIFIGSNQVDVVDEFKLLGVILDSKLNF